MAAAIPIVVGIGSAIANSQDESGINESKVGNFTKDPNEGFDPHEYEYGGGYWKYTGAYEPGPDGRPVPTREWVSGESVQRGRAESLNAEFGKMGADAQNRTAAQLNPHLMDQSRDLGMGSRGEQIRALQNQHIGLGMAHDAAMGIGPSVAQEQLKLGMDRTIKNNLSTAASVRGGPGASALAARTAVMGNAQAGQDLAGQAALLRAQETATGRSQFITGADALSRSAAGIRTSDAAAYNTDLQRAGANLDAEMKQRSMNDAFQTSMAQNRLAAENLRHQANLGGAMGRQAAQDARQRGYEFEQGGNANIAASNAAFKERRFQNVMGSLQSAATAAASAGEGKKGGGYPT